MPLAVDASVAFKWFVPDAGGDEALALLDGEEPLWAPDLVLLELGNALAFRLGRIEHGLAAATGALNRISGVYGRLLPSTDFVQRALELSFELRHPIYDCIYLAMVEREKIDLITADKKLLRVVGGTAHASRVRLLKTDGQDGG